MRKNKNEQEKAVTRAGTKGFSSLSKKKSGGPHTLTDVSSCCCGVEYHTTPSDSPTNFPSPSTRSRRQAPTGSHHLDPVPSRAFQKLLEPPKPLSALGAPAAATAAAADHDRRAGSPSGDGVHRRARRGDAEALQVQRAGPLGAGQVRAPALLEPLRHPLPAMDAVSPLSASPLTMLFARFYSAHWLEQEAG